MRVSEGTRKAKGRKTTIIDVNQQSLLQGQLFLSISQQLCTADHHLSLNLRETHPYL